MLTSIFSPASFAEVLRLRLPKDAARSSTITASTVGTARLRIANCELRIGNADRSFVDADTFIFNCDSEGETTRRQSGFRRSLPQFRTGQIQSEGRAFTGLRVDVQRAAAFLDEPLDDVQSQARPLSRAFRREATGSRSPPARFHRPVAGEIRGNAAKSRCNSSPAAR